MHPPHLIELSNAELVEMNISEAVSYICTGSEAAGLMRLCEQHLGELQWFGQDVDAMGWSEEACGLFAGSSPVDMTHFGPTAVAAPCVAEVSQFLDAAFFCTPMPPARVPARIEWDEHTSAHTLPTEVLALLHFHDTAWIEVSTRDDGLARALRSVVERVRAR